MLFTDARAIVLARLGVSSGDAATVALVDAQLDLEYQRLVLEHHLEVDVAVLPTTAGDPVVDLPDDLTEIIKITPTGYQPLDMMTPDDYALALSGPAGDWGATGYMRNGARRIRIWPTPTADGELTLLYSTTAQTWGDGPGDDAEPSSLPAAYHDLPVERVVAYLALIDEATDLAALATARADALEERLRRHLARRGGQGRSTIPVAGQF